MYVFKAVLSLASYNYYIELFITLLELLGLVKKYYYCGFTHFILWVILIFFLALETLHDFYRETKFATPKCVSLS